MLTIFPLVFVNLAANKKALDSWTHTNGWTTKKRIEILKLQPKNPKKKQRRRTQLNNFYANLQQTNRKTNRKTLKNQLKTPTLLVAKTISTSNWNRKRKNGIMFAHLAKQYLRFHFWAAAMKWVTFSHLAAFPYFHHIFNFT